MFTLRCWRCFLEVLQADHINEVNNGSTGLTTLDTATVEVEWLRELLMDLSVVEKTIPILMNCDNQTMTVKVSSSKDNMKASRHVKRWLKSVRKMGNSRVIALDYV